MKDRAKIFFDLFKLRIGFAIGLTAFAGALAVPGRSAPGWQVALLVACVVAASASAGAFNQYAERDLDARMGRTRNRAFVTGRLAHGPFWLAVIGLMLTLSVCATALAVNPVAALFVFLGAFFYGVVYTVILKRRTWLNIVIGGLAGSFAVLAGATAVAPDAVGPVALALADVRPEAVEDPEARRRPEGTAEADSACVLRSLVQGYLGRSPTGRRGGDRQLLSPREGGQADQQDHHDHGPASPHTSPPVPDRQQP